MPLPQFETLTVELRDAVARIGLNRPGKANAINLRMWQELREAMRWLGRTESARVGILFAHGRHFCAGLDLATFGELQALTHNACEGRMREQLREHILDIQDTVTAIERCSKPVIAAVHAACVGGGIDIIAACDLRYASPNAWFCVKEIDVALVADVGTLQRLPRLIGDGLSRELALTGRRVDAFEAARMRLVNRCLDSDAALTREVEAIALCLASKSPLALRGTKHMLNHARDHRISDGLEHVATWNAAMLYSHDLQEAAAAKRDKRMPVFSD